jgi:hypothetical protein
MVQLQGASFHWPDGVVNLATWSRMASLEA